MTSFSSAWAETVWLEMEDDKEWKIGQKTTTVMAVCVIVTKNPCGSTGCLAGGSEVGFWSKSDQRVLRKGGLDRDSSSEALVYHNMDI
jgi:hypothetical protein